MDDWVFDLTDKGVSVKAFYTDDFVSWRMVVYDRGFVEIKGAK